MPRTTLSRTTLALVAAMLAGSATAQSLPAEISLTVDPARAAIDAFAVAIDANRDGHISPVEVDTAGRAVFASMDTDGDAMVTRQEMTGWEHGLGELAAFRNRTQAYDASLGLLFDLFDRDLSGTIDAAEHVQGMQAAWALADRDGDGTMSLAEFRDGFVVTAALRNGLTD